MVSIFFLIFSLRLPSLTYDSELVQATTGYFSVGEKCCTTISILENCAEILKHCMHSVHAQILHFYHLT